VKFIITSIESHTHYFFVILVTLISLTFFFFKFLQLILYYKEKFVMVLKKYHSERYVIKY